MCFFLLNPFLIDVTHWILQYVVIAVLCAPLGYEERGRGAYLLCQPNRSESAARLLIGQISQFVLLLVSQSVSQSFSIIVLFQFPNPVPVIFNEN